MNKVVTRVAFIVNPWAGIGGELALKGSDGEHIRAEAIKQDVMLKAPDRVKRFLDCLLPYKDSLSFITFPSFMGEHYLHETGFTYQLLCPEWQQSWQFDNTRDIPLTSAIDTQVAAKQASSLGVDILLFAGGDGTARDIAEGLETDSKQVCLGIPCGVKIQSAVYGRNPEASAASLINFLKTSGVSIGLREVRDLDEEALRQGKVGSRYFSELLVPIEQDELVSLQAGKQGSGQISQSAMEKEQLVHEEIAAYLMELFHDGLEISPLLIVGAGHTTAAFKRHLSDDASLLGVDVFLGSELIAKDVTEKALLALLEQFKDLHPTHIIVSVIGGQGCILGRGSQPISPLVLEKVFDRWGDDALLVLATETKLASLPGQQLFVDTGNIEMDERLSGSKQVIVDYDKRMFCKVLA